MTSSRPICRGLSGRGVPGCRLPLILGSDERQRLLRQIQSILTGVRVEAEPLLHLTATPRIEALSGIGRYQGIDAVER